MVVGRIRRKVAWTAGMVSTVLWLMGEAFLLGSKGLVRLGFVLNFCTLYFGFIFRKKARGGGGEERRRYHRFM